MTKTLAPPLIIDPAMPSRPSLRDQQHLPIVGSPVARDVERQEDGEQGDGHDPVEQAGRRVEGGLEEQRPEVDEPDVAHPSGAVGRPSRSPRRSHP